MALVLIATRLPVSARVDRGRVRVTRSPGGLANGLRSPHAEYGGDWVGWTGEASREEEREVLTNALAAQGAVPVMLTAAEVARFYEGFANGVLWPLFHYLLDRIPLDTRDWQVYARINERFAQVAAARMAPGDLAWVHDYQLCLVPRALRRLRPAARIGFFLHIPFPAAEVMRTLPWRRDLLEGMLGADLVGFHTRTYLGHFADSCRILLGAQIEGDTVLYRGREVRLGVFPMGVDAPRIAAMAREPDVIDEAAAMRAEGVRMMLGIDRLDYTKGIPRRLLALDRMLRRDPSLRGRVKMVQIAVPSREKVEAYRDLRRTVEELVGRITGEHANSACVPLHYCYRNLSERQVITHYCATDVMMVTPLRDGMNLVAKEFVAAREDGDGVLVLSELAGAAEELEAALKVNPYDVEGTAATMRRALSMPEAERRARMAALRARVFGYDVHRWAGDFMAALDRPQAPRPRPPGEVAIVERLGPAGPRVMLLDYDGTLVGFAARPELAAPDPELLELLLQLSRRASLHLVSGRKKEDLEQWFGHLQVGLHAEHGLWMRLSPSDPWERAPVPPATWMDVVRPTMEATVLRVEGSFIEEKSASLAFHFRAATDAEDSVRELRHQLHELARWLPVDPIEGSAVLEVRARGINKGHVVTRLLELGRLPGPVLAVGDDHTDEDMFAALPDDAVTVQVGDRPSQAGWRLPDVEAVRALLRALAEKELVPG